MDSTMKEIIVTVRRIWSTISQALFSRLRTVTIWPYLGRRDLVFVEIILVTHSEH
jgi:hypothetical protein